MTLEIHVLTHHELNLRNHNKSSSDGLKQKCKEKNKSLLIYLSTYSIYLRCTEKKNNLFCFPNKSV